MIASAVFARKPPCKNTVRSNLRIAADRTTTAVVEICVDFIKETDRRNES